MKKFEFPSNKVDVVVDAGKKENCVVLTRSVVKKR